MFVKDPRGKLPSFALGEIMACNYCVHFQELGKNEAEGCANPKSPQYPLGRIITYAHISELSPKQMLLGCQLIKHTEYGWYHGQISPDVMRLVPMDSSLRMLPLEKLVKGYEPGMKLDSRWNTTEFIRKSDEANAIIWPLVIKYGYSNVQMTDGGWIVPDEKLKPDDRNAQ